MKTYGLWIVYIITGLAATVLCLYWYDWKLLVIVCLSGACSNTAVKLAVYKQLGVIKATMDKALEWIRGAK